MTEPILDDTTERTYSRFPGVYRFEDSQNDWTMKRWLSGICSVLEEINVLIERFNFTPIEDGYKEAVDLHSDLVDPTTADSSWLSWISQLVGVQYDPLLSDATQRERINTALDGAQPGTEAAIVQAAQTVLTGTKTVYVYPRSTAVGGVGAGTQWEVLVRTLAAEETGDVLAAIINLGAKPAGVKLYHDNYSASWTTVETNHPTWADWDATTWQQLEQG